MALIVSNIQVGKSKCLNIIQSFLKLKPHIQVATKYQVTLIDSRKFDKPDLDTAVKFFGLIERKWVWK
ncbi:unnamed protein product [Paramecium octaurelia]|uniref:Uncharacterized protein n=1 Tax=Paramecium octaurelia TaxID=43137 RepID=A0A8S1VPR1_PAROT|nr:unnamed protein product [Paramecium octaurelia]